MVARINPFRTLFGSGINFGGTKDAIFNNRIAMLRQAAASQNTVNNVKMTRNDASPTTMSRQALTASGLDDRRNIDDECGYPPDGMIPLDIYRSLFDRDAISNRVVEVLPKECWQQQPLVFEDEDTDTITEFEKAWDDLGKSLRPEKSWYQDEEGSPIWEYLKRIDILSGIGSFGVLLLGFDDGKRLDEPLDGVSSLEPPEVPGFGGPLAQPTMQPGQSSPGLDTGGFKDQVDAKDDPEAKAAKGQTQETGANPAKTQKPKSRKSPSANIRKFIGNMSIGGKLSEENQKILDNQIKLYKQSEEAVINYIRESGMTANFADFTDPPGTDFQYVGVQLSPPEYPADKPSTEKRKLVFIRPYDEWLVQVVQYEANIHNPRFGMPKMYRITLNDPREVHSGVGLPLATVMVHWSRVIHIADNLKSSEIFGIPRMRPVLNRLLDLYKAYGASAESYWQGCINALSFETHPQLGGDVEVNVSAMQDQIEQFFNGLQKHLLNVGMAAKTIAPTVTDPTPHITVAIEAICIQLGIPVRVFKGSERGELASSQDDSSWNDRLAERQKNYITPRIIVPFIDRLISAGVLPEPKGPTAKKPGNDGATEDGSDLNANVDGVEDDVKLGEEADDSSSPEKGDKTTSGYSIKWPDLDSTTDDQKAGISLKKTQALAAFVQGGCEAAMSVKNWFIFFLGMDEEEAEEIVQDASDNAETMTIPPPGEDGHPATPPPPPVIPGMGPDGKPLPGAKPGGAKPPAGAKPVAAKPPGAPKPPGGAAAGGGAAPSAGAPKPPSSSTKAPPA